jgi:four helix bundle suffix protein
MKTTPLFRPSGGFRHLDSWVLASVVQLANYEFCERFLDRKTDPTGRQYDQMTQAARSGKANITEGSARAATSKETELKLTDVAYASLAELAGDYEDFLMRRRQIPWHKESPEAKAVFDIRLDPPDYKDDAIHYSCAHILVQKDKFDRWFQSGDSVVFANAMLILIRRVMRMLEKQSEWLLENFAHEGGFREQLTEIRTEARVRQEDAPACPECGKAMKRRKSAKGEFWGCTGFPECHGTRKIDFDKNR